MNRLSSKGDSVCLRLFLAGLCSLLPFSGASAASTQDALAPTTLFSTRDSSKASEAEAPFKHTREINGRVYAFEQVRLEDAAAMTALNNRILSKEPNLLMTEDQMREWIAANPRSLVARDAAGEIVGFIFVAFLSHQDFPTEYAAMTRAHRIGKEKECDTMVDFWVVADPVAAGVGKALPLVTKKLADQLNPDIRYIVAYSRPAELEASLVQDEKEGLLRLERKDGNIVMRDEEITEYIEERFLKITSPGRMALENGSPLSSEEYLLRLPALRRDYPALDESKEAYEIFTAPRGTDAFLAYARRHAMENPNAPPITVSAFAKRFGRVPAARVLIGMHEGGGAALSHRPFLGRPEDSRSLGFNYPMFYRGDPQAFFAPPSARKPGSKTRLKWIKGVEAVRKAPRGDRQIRFLSKPHVGFTLMQKARYMGNVYWAKRVNHVSRDKMLMWEGLHLFRLGQKNQQGICHARHFLQLKDGSHVILLDLLPPGQTLWKYLNRGRKTIHQGEALDLLLQLARTVQELQANGLLHWDIAPNNIWITDTGEALLFDFDLSFGSRKEFLQRNYIVATIGTRHVSRARYEAFINPSPLPAGFPSMADEIYALARVLGGMVKGYPTKRIEPRIDAKALLAAVDEDKNIVPALKALLRKSLADGKSQYGDIGSFINDLEACREAVAAKGSRGKGSPAAMLKKWLSFREEYLWRPYSLKTLMQDFRAFSRTTVRTELEMLEEIGLVEVDRSKEEHLYYLNDLLLHTTPEVRAGLCDIPELNLAEIPAALMQAVKDEVQNILSAVPRPPPPARSWREDRLHKLAVRFDDLASRKSLDTISPDLVYEIEALETFLGLKNAEDFFTVTFNNLQYGVYPYRQPIAGKVAAENPKEALARLAALIEGKARQAKRPIVVYVTGRPATGKSSWTDQIAETGIGPFKPRDIDVFHLDFRFSPDEKMKGAQELSYMLYAGTQLVFVEGIDPPEHYLSITEFSPARHAQAVKHLGLGVDLRVFVEKNERERVQDLYLRSKPDAQRHRESGFNAFNVEFGAPWAYEFSPDMNRAVNLCYRYGTVDRRRADADVIVNSSRGHSTGDATFDEARIAKGPQQRGDRGKGSPAEMLRAWLKLKGDARGQSYSVQELMREMRNFSETTVRRELKALMSVGLVKEDKAARPYRYFLSATLLRAPPEIQDRVCNIPELNRYQISAGRDRVTKRKIAGILKNTPPALTVDQLALDPSVILEALKESDRLHSSKRQGIGHFGMLTETDVGAAGYTSRAFTYYSMLYWLKKYAGPLMGKRILEIGPGPGMFMLAMRDMGLSIEGLEPNDIFVEMAKEWGLQMHQGSILNPPKEILGNPYAITFSAHVFDALRKEGKAIPKHEYRTASLQALRQTARLTEPGGISILLVESITLVKREWALRDEDFAEVGFDILEGSADSRMVVLRRKSEEIPGTHNVSGIASQTAIKQPEKIGSRRVSPESSVAEKFPYAIVHDGRLDASLLNHYLRQIASEIKEVQGYAVEVKASLAGSALYLSDSRGEVPLDAVKDLDMPFYYRVLNGRKNDGLDKLMKKTLKKKMKAVFGKSIGKLQFHPIYCDKEQKLYYPPFRAMRDELINWKGQDDHEKNLKRYLCFEFYFGDFVSGSLSDRNFHRGLIARLVRGVSPKTLWQDVLAHPRWDKISRSSLHHAMLEAWGAAGSLDERDLKRKYEDFANRSPRARELRMQRQEAMRVLDMRGQLYSEQAA